MENFVRDWIDCWNRGDVEAVLTHFAGDVVFVSAKAEAFTGRSSVEGKAALRAYWSAAVARIKHLRFTLDHFAWDPAARTLAIVYTAELDDKRDRALELLRLDADGLAVRGEAFYGAAV